MANPFVDPEVEPTSDLVADALGPAIEGWDALMREPAEAGVEVAVAVVPRRRTAGQGATRARAIAWIAVDGTATTCNFLFAERLGDAVATLPDLTPDLARQIRDEPLRGKLFGVAFTASTPADVDRLRPILKACVALR
ncbi:hypothetical protein [Kitasatospora griseola]|uniref:hypothetical protein n=1 Tax=Kitasatospora griseola TaxID=2064 RepID=UPI003830C4D4